MIVYKRYNRERAVAYARRWAFSRNPLFYDFTGVGGDCTSFVSQCVLAGSCVMNFTADFGWYYRTAEDRAPAWSGVEFFWDFMIGAPSFLAENGGVGPFGREVSIEELEVGDVIQLGDEAGDYYHTLLVSGFAEGGPLVAAHSVDSLDRPLDTYRYALARYLHIDGVRMEVGGNDCYPALIEGRAIEVE